MYRIGEQIVYGVHGVCTVSAVTDRTVDRKTHRYYVLESAEQKGATYFVPQDNEAALSRMHRILSREQLLSLLQSEAVRRGVWIPDEVQRKQRYHDLLASGDRTELICMVRTLRRQKQGQQAAGKKFHLCDENFLRDAERMLDSEFSVVLCLPREQISDYVHEVMSHS